MTGKHSGEAGLVQKELENFHLMLDKVSLLILQRKLQKKLEQLERMDAPKKRKPRASPHRLYGLVAALCIGYLASIVLGHYR